MESKGLMSMGFYIFWCNKNGWDWIETVVAQHYECTKCYRIVRFKMADFVLK